MKKHMVILTVFFLCAAWISMDSFAQQAKNLRGQRRGGGQLMSRMYNPQSVISVKGTVNKIEKMQYGRGRYFGLHITLKTEAEELSVHLGPAWFIENEMMIETGNMVEITGSKIIYNNTPTIIASQIKNENQLLQLRNEVGIPVWSRSGVGRRRRQM